MAKNRKSIKLIIIFIVIAIIVAIGVVLYQNNEKKYQYSLVEINDEDINYYVLEENDKYGVIDKNGNVIIETKYASIAIPNPTKDVFICTESLNDKANWKAIDSKGNQLLTDYDDVEAISLKQITSKVPYEKSVLKYKKNGYYGLIDFNGKKITEPIYEEISNIDYKEGCLQVKKDGKYGAININGTVIIKPEYDNITADGYYDSNTKYSEAGFIIRTKTDNGYRFGYANKREKIILEPNYNEVNRITEIEDSKNTYLIPSTNGKYGLVKNGKQILENEYDDISYDKANNIIIIEKGDAKGVYNLDGKNIIPIDYDNITIGGTYISASKENKTVVFDTNGNEINTDITSYTKVSDNYSIIIDKDNNYNIVDNAGNKLLNEKYAYIDYFANDYFIVTKDAKTGIINSAGKVIVPIQYRTIPNLEKTSLLQATDGKTKRIDIIDSNAKVEEGIANATISVESNYIKIYSDTDVKYFNMSGNSTTYQELFPENEFYAKKQNGKWGLVDKSGNTIVPFKYEMVTEQNGNVAGVKLNGKWGVVNTKGESILEPTYKIGWNDIQFLGKYYEISDNVGVAIYCADKEQ